MSYSCHASDVHGFKYHFVWCPHKEMVTPPSSPSRSEVQPIYPSLHLLVPSCWIAIRGLIHDAVGAADEAEETGWKFVHADVFRFPEHPNLFAAVIGTGTQMTFMTFAIFALALVRCREWRAAAKDVSINVL